MHAPFDLCHRGWVFWLLIYGTLQAFHDGDVRFLICTDLAARGLDIKGLPYVVNLTLPDEPENYIHHIGTFRKRSKRESVCIYP